MYTTCSSSGARARVDVIDFNRLPAPLGGGGHERAASAALKLTVDDATSMMQRLVQSTVDSIPAPQPVTAHMTTNVLTVRPTDALARALEVMNDGGKKGLPVVDEYSKLQGMITMRDIRMAVAKGGDDVLAHPAAGSMHRNPVAVAPATPFYEASTLVQESALGRLPVIDDQRRLVGLVTRTDVLVAQKMYTNNVYTEE